MAERLCACLQSKTIEFDSRLPLHGDKMLKVYNTLTRKEEEFIPLEKGKVKMFVCGQTVYDDAHLGHAKTYINFDVIVRWLRYLDFKVFYAQNITDIDDKIIKRANERGMSFKELAEFYIKRFFEDMEALGVKQNVDLFPESSEYIPQIIEQIQTLIKKGYAYVIGGDVYYDVDKFKDYTKLSRMTIKELTKHRIEPDSRKKNTYDFSLWKSAKLDEPFWDSPWGKGRPGWHIECSVMSQKFLKTDTLDIHAGGRDLIFPHHENEIAQAEAVSGKPFAKCWIHHGLLTINGQKMAKSLGNFVTIKDFINKHKDPDLLKLFFLSAHYSHPIDYNEEKIEEARKQKNSFEGFFDKVNNWGLLEEKTKITTSAADRAKIDNICAKFEKAIDDDFNTPGALACLFELVDLGSAFVSADKKEAFNYAKEKLENFFGILGLKVTPKKKIPEELLVKLSEIETARANKDFKKADMIREEIKTKFKFAVSNTRTNITITEIKQ